MHKGSAEQMYDAMVAKLEELEGGYIESATNTTNIDMRPIIDEDLIIEADDQAVITSAIDVDDIRDEFIQVLIDEVEKDVKSLLTGLDWQIDDAEDALVLTGVSNSDNHVLEFTIPFDDLSFNIDEAEKDKDTILEAVQAEVDKIPKEGGTL